MNLLRFFSFDQEIMSVEKNKEGDIGYYKRTSVLDATVHVYCTIFHDQADVFFGLQDSDVGEGVAVDDDEVGEFAGFEGADFGL